MSLPEPYFEADGIVIYHADCMDVLPHLPPVDLVLTDPPYGIGESNEKNLTRAVLASNTDFGHFDWDQARVPERVQLAVSKGRHAVVWGGNYYTDVLPWSPSWIIWDKENGQTDFADVEMAWTNHNKAARLFRWRWHGMLRKNGEKRFYPTQKPLSLMLWAIQNYLMKGDLILDAFMGSGTVLEAAKRLNLRSIGIDKSERACEIAARRIMATPAPLPFPEPEPAPVQAALFS